MSFKCGIIGLPNVGKSTLFNAITKLNVKAHNFPFCTIEPNVGVAPILDLRLFKLAKIIEPQKIVPNTIHFIDIAGLIKGASKGEGLGNKFLSKISEVEAILHVVRCFEKNEIIHINGRLNPLEDISIINTELILFDIKICDTAIQNILKKIKNGDKQSKKELIILKQCMLQLNHSRVLRSLPLNKEEKQLINYHNFLTLKPNIYVANIAEYNFEKNNYFDQITKIAKEDNSIAISICAIMEANITKLSEKEIDSFIKELGISQLGVNKLIQDSYKLLNLKTFFTIGKKEVRAWTITNGSNAMQAAGKIHSDFKRGFIRAEVISYNDFILYKSKQKVKEAGKIRYEGRNYLLNDGDIINFLFKI